MRVLIVGSHGLIGTAITEGLQKQGHEVFSLVRDKKQLSDHAVLWDPYKGEVDKKMLEGFDVTLNLAGENIASGTWTEKKKKKILDSRVRCTRFLCEQLAQLQNPPKVHINASAIGYYGDGGDKLLNEDSGSGEGFLPEVVREWENATDPAKNAGIRVVMIRIGIVLSQKGGALGRMLTPFKFGLGGVLGSGKQYMSWIAIDDVVGGVLHMIGNESLSGPVNLVAPNPETNRDFTKTLGKVLKRPTIFPVPAFVLRFILGRELADQLLLKGARVSPDKLVLSGFTFLYPELEGALRYIVNKD